MTQDEALKDMEKRGWRCEFIYGMFRIIEIKTGKDLGVGLTVLYAYNSAVKKQADITS